MGRKISGVWHYGWRRDLFQLNGLDFRRAIDRYSIRSPLILARSAHSRLLLRVGLGFLWVWLGFACVADLAFAGCRGRRWIPFSFSPYSVFEFFLSGLWMDRPKEIVQMGLCVVEVWEWRKR